MAEGRCARRGCQARQCSAIGAGKRSSVESVATTQRTRSRAARGWTDVQRALASLIRAPASESRELLACVTSCGAKRNVNGFRKTTDKMIILFWSKIWNSLLKTVAGELGFEPRLTESESAVLPLNYSPKPLWPKSLDEGLDKLLVPSGSPALQLEFQPSGNRLETEGFHITVSLPLRQPFGVAR
jgi:hypothetical protein